MANQLKKLANVQYTPGSPYVPAQPAYCTTVVTETTGLQYTSTDVQYVTDANGQTVLVSGWQQVYDTVVTTQQVCYPGAPAIPAVPSSLTYSSIVGWNGGGRSIYPLTGAGFFDFKLSSSPLGIVVGLSAGDVSTLPSEPTHAFYVHGTTVDVMESGVTVVTAPTAYDTAKPLRIARYGAQVTYQYDGWSYTSGVLSDGPVYLDAAIYASGDFVYDPVVGQTGALALILPPLTVMAGEGAYATADLRLPALNLVATGTTGQVGSIALNIGRVDVWAADHRTGEGRVTLPALTAYSEGGYPAPQLIYAGLAIPPQVVVARGMTGEVGSAAITLPTVQVWGADHRTGEGRVTLKPQRLFGLTTPAVDFGLASNGALLLSGAVLAYSSPVATIRSGIQFAPSVAAERLVEALIQSAIALSGDVTGYRQLVEAITSGLLLGGWAGSPAAAQQYAVNVLTKALTTYAGFDFTAFARTSGDVYAAKADGIYRLRAGDDDGQPISAAVDFGTTDFGTPNTKTVGTVFLGLDTDGDVTVTLGSDGVERSYGAIHRGPMTRINGAKGVTARQWNLRLDVADATTLRLDTLEQLVAVSTRRWTR